MALRNIPLSNSLPAELEKARASSDSLFDLLHPDSLYERPIAERHRILFYLGHLEAFDWNLIAIHGLDLPRFHPQFDQLFAFGIDPDSTSLPKDKPSDWPRIDEVRHYNATVRAKLNARLDQVNDMLLHVAIEHRRMHEETFAYMLHNLAYEHKLKPPAPARPIEAPHEPGMLEIPGGSVFLGRPRNDGFGWDNEFDRHERIVAPFSVSRYKVTNTEYSAFVEAGGPAPHFWRERGGRWFYRGMFEETPLHGDWPVYVTHEQATQYARWLGKRLPTEAEFHRASCGTEPEPLCDNFDSQRWDPISVTSGQPNPFGLVQMIGNGWEWTSSRFEPFPGFQPFPFYRNYSQPFFDGEHYVLKGASARTAARLTRPSFRNWFRGSYPYVYAAFRLAEG